MALSAEPHDRFIAYNLQKIETRCPGPVLSLLKSLLCHDHLLRPTADELEETCEDIIAQLSGLKLRRWCKARDWTGTEAEVSGELVGRTIEETTLSFDKQTKETTSADTFSIEMLSGDEKPPAEHTTPLPFDQSDSEFGSTTGSNTPAPSTMASSPLSPLPRAELDRKWTSAEWFLLVGLAVVIVMAIFTMVTSYNVGPQSTAPIVETPP